MQNLSGCEGPEMNDDPNRQDLNVSEIVGTTYISLVWIVSLQGKVHRDPLGSCKENTGTHTDNYNYVL